MKLRLTIDGGEVIADFTGSAPQAVGPVNAIYAVTASAIYNAFLHLTDPTIPRNEGCYRPFTIIAPPGHDRELLASRRRSPAATPRRARASPTWCSARSSTRSPSAIAASCGGTSSPFLFGGTDPAHGRAVRALPLRGRRLGRTRTGSTATTWSSRSTATAATRRSRSSRRATRRSASSRTGCVADSGGPGEFRGGLGGERIFTVTVPGGHGQRAAQPDEDRAVGRARRRRRARSAGSGCAAPATRSGARSSRSSGRCRRRSSPA